jgi:hypothetical protein
MQTQDDAKRRAMDAVSHRETTAQKMAFQNGCASPPTAAAAKSSAPMLGVAKQQAMSAIASVETIAQIGLVKLTGGVALYAAHIRQMDRQAPRQQRVRRDAIGRAA